MCNISFAFSVPDNKISIVKFFHFGKGNFLQSFLISSFIFFADAGFAIISFIQAAICFISFSFMPRVVIAGVPRRRPEGLNGPAGSYGIAFLFVEIPLDSKRS